MKSYALMPAEAEFACGEALPDKHRSLGFGLSQSDPRSPDAVTKRWHVRSKLVTGAERLLSVRYIRPRDNSYTEAETMHKLPNLILPAMVTLALAGPVIAQSSTTSSEGVGAVPEASTTIPESVEVVADVLTGQKEGQTMASKLIGLPLVNNEGKELGEVSDLIIDEKQQIVGATLSVGGFLGLGSGSIGVPWDSLRIDYRDGVAVAVTGMSEEQLADAPEFKTLAEIQAEKAALERAAQQQREMELQRQQMQPEQTEGQQQPSSQ